VIFLHKDFFFNEKLEVLIPSFAGILVSLIFCALIAVNLSFFSEQEIITMITAEKTVEKNIEEEEKKETRVFFLSSSEEIQDPVLEYYRNQEYQEWVVEFFKGICPDHEIAQIILIYADEFDVPVALAFALGWEESNFNPLAVNRNNLNGSVDRGLFQLNNRSFPNLETREFFDVNTNARHGISHLRYCLDTGGSEISALAMYNAGAGRVSNTGAPKVTLDYISRILETRSRIESLFHSMLIKEEENRIGEKIEEIIEPVEPEPQSRVWFNTLRILSSASPL
jgi:hypothetical protein